MFFSDTSGPALADRGLSAADEERQALRTLRIFRVLMDDE